MSHIKKKIFRFEKAKWKYRFNNPEGILVEDMYYRMMYALWTNNHDKNDRIKKELLPCVKRTIIIEMTRLKKKVGITKTEE